MQNRIAKLKLDESLNEEAVADQSSSIVQECVSIISTFVIPYGGDRNIERIDFHIIFLRFVSAVYDVLWRDAINENQ